MTRRGFTLLELLVVIAISSVMMAMLVPAMSKVRLQAKVVAVNAELSNIALALEAYGMDNDGRFPPTRADCNPDARDHRWALPRELAEQGYIALGKAGDVIYSRAEDRFNPGYMYKYVAPGPRLDYYGMPGVQTLQIPDGFPGGDGETYTTYSDAEKSPVTWVIFSVGPEFDEQAMMLEGFPVARRFWYSPQEGTGLITRVRLKDTYNHIGTFND